MPTILPESIRHRAAASQAPRAAAARDTSQLRIAIVSDAVSERNGVGSYYHDLASGLRPRVAKVHLYCPGSEWVPRRSRIGIPMPGDSTQRIEMPPIRSLLRSIEELAPHTIVVPTPGPYGMLGLHAARRSGARLVVGYHTHLEKLADLYWKRLSRSVNLYYLKTCHRLLFRHASVILANSQEMVEIAEQLAGRAVEIMGTPIPRRFLEQPVTPPRPQLRRLLFIGRLAPEKNVEDVIEAARELPDMRVTIAGDGPLAEEIRASAAELPWVEAPGWLSREQVLEAIDACDLLLLPSRVESFGTVVVEAMARHRPPLVSASCGILEWPDLATGLFRIREGESLAQAVRRIEAAGPEERAARAARGRAAAERFDRWNLDRWLDILAPDPEAGPETGDA